MRTDTDFSNYVGHEVVDKDHNKVGTLACLWADHTGQPAFLGVRTGWLLGRTHVVPAHDAAVSEHGRRIRLPFEADHIRNAPAFDPDATLDENDERKIRAYYGTPPSTVPAAATAAERSSGREAASVPLREEEMKVGKRQVEYAGIRLRKIVRIETVNQPVELRREEIVIERVPIGQEGNQPAQIEGAFEQEEIYIPLRREEPVIEKSARVREEVRVSKRSESEHQNVQGTIRKEDVQIDRAGNDKRRGPLGSDRWGLEGKLPPVPTPTPASNRNQSVVVGLAQNENQSSRILDQLTSSGFPSDDISVMMADQRSSREFTHDHKTKEPEGATAGVPRGGAASRGGGWLAGAGAIAIPGGGAFVAAGPILGILGGASSGGLANALVGMGISELDANRYQARVNEGQTLICVHSDSSDETLRVRDIFQRNEAQDISVAREEEPSEHRR